MAAWARDLARAWTWLLKSEEKARIRNREYPPYWAPYFAGDPRAMSRLSDLAPFTDRRLAKRYATRPLPMHQILAHKNLDTFYRRSFLGGASLSCLPVENTVAAEEPL
jgi:hypothetical protein